MSMCVDGTMSTVLIDIDTKLKTGCVCGQSDDKSVVFSNDSMMVNKL